MIGVTEEVFKTSVDKVILNQRKIKSYKVEGFKVTVEYITNSGKSSWETNLYFSAKDGGSFRVKKPDASYTAPDLLAKDIMSELKKYSV